jgi:hypothetical protein
MIHAGAGRANGFSRHKLSDANYFQLHILRTPTDLGSPDQVPYHHSASDMRQFELPD